MASPGAAQSQPLARQRQDRRAALPTTPAEPIPEVYVAAGNLTTVAFNGPLDRDSLVVDRTRFKWVDVGDRILAVEPFADLGPGERLIMQVGFKDKGLPAKAILAVVSKAEVMDGKVEVDRRANSPEALLAALRQKEAELEDLKARCAGNGPASLILSGWLTSASRPISLHMSPSAADGLGLEATRAFGYKGKTSTLIAFWLRNPMNQKTWVSEHAHVTSAAGTSVEVLSVQMQPVQLEPDHRGLVVVEVKTPPWADDKPFGVELMDASGQRRSFNLLHTKEAP